MAKATEFLSPVLRLVQGDAFEPQTKDAVTGLPLTVKTGPNAGQPTQKYFIACAGSKTDAEVIKLKALFDAEARTAWPQFFPVPGGPCVNPNFSTKIIDGDGVDQNGKPNNTKEGFAGCWIFRFSSSYPPKCFAAGKYQPHEALQVVGGVNPIPRGHFVRVAGNVSGNNNAQRPGLYVNLNMIEWNSVGPVIVSGPDASQVFGGGAPAGGQQMTQLAGGVSYADHIAQGWTDALLIEHKRMLPPVAASAPPPPAAAVGAPPPPGATSAPPPPAAALAAPPPPPPPVQPHTAILAGGPQMTDLAGGVSYADHIAQGWTDALLIENKRMLPSAPAPLATSGSAPPPPPAATASAPPPPVGKVMLPGAGGVSYEAHIAQGWTDAMLIQHQKMAA